LTRGGWPLVEGEKKGTKGALPFFGGLRHKRFDEGKGGDTSNVLDTHTSSSLPKNKTYVAVVVFIQEGDG
jgi:hypothetical protein